VEKLVNSSDLKSDASA